MARASSSPPASDADVVIIGAGISGLCAAGRLVRAGRRVLVLEKSRGVGGRMATRRIGAAVCDHGAQFFTVREPAFGALVADAEAAGAVAVWCHGFSPGGEPPVGDGHPRWRGSVGMTDLPKRLAALATAGDVSACCTIRTASRVVAVGTTGDRAGDDTIVHVEVVVEPTADGPPERITARGALVTAPVPQALDLLATADADLDGDATRRLATVGYDPCFALMAVLERPSRVPPPGAIQFAAGVGGDGPVAWIADNQMKGVSSIPALTVHATGRFTRDHFDAPPDDVVKLLIDHVRPWIDGDPARTVVETSLHRWKFAQPTTILPEPLVPVSEAPPIACCGDAFAGPRVEGAAASGLAAGEWMDRALATLDRKRGIEPHPPSGTRSP